MFFCVKGIRAGLKRTYQGISQDMMEYMEMPEYHPMIYAVSFLHTVVQVCNIHIIVFFQIPFPPYSKQLSSRTFFQIYLLPSSPHTYHSKSLLSIQSSLYIHHFLWISYNTCISKLLFRVSFIQILSSRSSSSSCHLSKHFSLPSVLFPNFSCKSSLTR